MKTNKIIALALAGVLSLSVLTGCQDSSSSTTTDETTTTTTTTTEVEPLEGTILTIAGQEISVAEYAYTFNKAYMTLDQEFGYILSSGTEVEGMPETSEINEMIREYAIALLQEQIAVEELLTNLGLEATEEDMAELDTMIEETITSLGGEEYYISALAELGISREDFEQESLNTLVFQNCILDVYGNASLSDEELYAVYETDFLKAKHILIPFESETGDMSEEINYESTLETANSVLAMVEEGEDFDYLIYMYGYDSGQPTNGYAFVPGTMVTEFEDAVLALEDNETSGLIETVYGYHIIKRIEPSQENFDDNMDFILAGTSSTDATTALYDIVDAQSILRTTMLDSITMESYAYYLEG